MELRDVDLRSKDMVQNWFFHFLIPLNISVVIVRISALKKWVHGYSHAYLLAISLKRQGIFGNINANLIVSMLKLLQVSMWSKQPQSPCCHSASAIIAGKSNHNDIMLLGILYSTNIEYSVFADKLKCSLDPKAKLQTDCWTTSKKSLHFYNL